MNSRDDTRGPLPRSSRVRYHPLNPRERRPMTHLTELARTMQDLLTTQADRLASRCGFVKRKRKVTGATSPQPVASPAMADSDAPKSRSQVIAAAVGLNVSRQALDQRFDARGADFLRELLRVAVAEMVATPVALPLLRRFTAV